MQHLAKPALRQQARLLRDGLSPLDGTALAARLLSYLGAWLPHVVGGYWPIGSEVDPRPVMARLRSRGVAIALPQVAAAPGPLVFRGWAEGAPLVPGRFGTLHAQGEPMQPDLLLVPLLAFDDRGHRLGYGGGHYDRTLAAWPHVRAIGCAYAAQAVTRLPDEPTDISLHAVVTEHGVTEFRKV